jgi:multidrug efflux system membrane fusion protein
VPVEVTDGEDTKHVIATGTLLTPNNTIDTTTGTISLKANFANTDDHLWPGQFVNTRVQVDTLKNAVTVPVSAIEHGPDGLFVYETRSDGSVDQTDVQVGYQNDSEAVVTKGLTGQETVVVSGQSRLAPGVRVKATAVAESLSQPPA